MKDPLEDTVCQIESNDPLPLLTADQEKMIHEELSQKISEVQLGLSTLPKKFSSGEGLNSRDQSCFHTVRSGKKATNQSRPLDLLEVYCSPFSQLTKWVNKRGGNAKRFSAVDGDLNTEAGVQKL